MNLSTEERLHAAEKTVAILKGRVKSLYNEGAQTAIHRQLERARERDEAARQKRAIMEAKNAELERYSAELEGVVASRTAELRAILDNVTFGFVVINEDAQVQPGFTRSCSALFGRELEAGDDLVDLFGANESTAAPMIRMGIAQVFDDFMPADVAAEQIPSHFTIEGRRIRAEYRPIRDEADSVSSILVTLSDVTSLWTAEREAKRNAALISILRQKPAFTAFLNDSRSRLEACELQLADDAFVRRSIHTIKGNAASYGLDAVADTAHAIEENVSITAADLTQLTESLDVFLKENRAVLGEDVASGSPAVEVSAAEFAGLRKLLDPIDVNALESWGKRLLERPALEIAGPIDTLVERIAERLDRRVDFQIEGRDTPMDLEVMQPVLNTLSHILRNAVDHGIEAECERGDKPAAGKLVTRFAREECGWSVEVEDDGRGIDVDQLVQRAVERGDLTEENAAALTEEERIELIFLDGLSSRASATDLSGRGVGMSAVREAVEAQGGTVSVETSSAGTKFRLSVPAKG